MKKEIEQLTELQVIDLQVAELDGKMNGEQAEQEKRQQAIQELQDSITELQQKIDAAETKRRELDAEFSDELSRIKERQSKMMQVQTNREYQSLLKEIEDGKRNNKDREDEIVQLMEQIESFEKIMAEQASSCKKEEKSIAEESGKVGALVKKLNAQKNKILKKRNSKAKNFDAVLLRKYDMLRERRNGKAVVGVDAGVCQGCFMTIPPQQYNEILRGDSVMNCPTCQRILYYLESAE